MARMVFYQIVDRPDGTFSDLVTMEPDKSHARDGFRNLAEASEWVEGLRILMAACGAPLVSLDVPEDPASLSLRASAI